MGVARSRSPLEFSNLSQQTRINTLINIEIANELEACQTLEVIIITLSFGAIFRNGILVLWPGGHCSLLGKNEAWKTLKATVTSWVTLRHDQH